jgi:hypothetical protein
MKTFIIALPWMDALQFMPTYSNFQTIYGGMHARRNKSKKAKLNRRGWRVK